MGDSVRNGVLALADWDGAGAVLGGVAAVRTLAVGDADEAVLGGVAVRAVDGGPEVPGPGRWPTPAGTVAERLAVGTTRPAGGGVGDFGGVLERGADIHPSLPSMSPKTDQTRGRPSALRVRGPRRAVQGTFQGHTVCWQPRLPIFSLSNRNA